MPRRLRPTRPAPFSRIAVVTLLLEDLERRGLVQARLRPDGEVGYYALTDKADGATKEMNA